MPNKKRIFAIINICLIIALIVGIVFWINRDEGKSVQTEVSFTAEAGKSILEQTEQQTDAKVEDQGQGAYINAIGGLENGDQDGGVWIYYVNGLQPDTVPGDYITKGGELVEWKFELP
jgi:hypothetical protein